MFSILKEHHRILADEKNRAWRALKCFACVHKLQPGQRANESDFWKKVSSQRCPHSPLIFCARVFNSPTKQMYIQRIHL